MFTEDDYPLLLVILAAAVAWLASELYRRRHPVARRKSSDFRREATRDLFELELDSGDVVTFSDPNRLPSQDAFTLYRESDPERQLRALLNDDDWGKFWDEYRERPVDETNALSESVQSHYGANRGERRSSPS